MTYTVHTSAGIVRCIDLRLAARVRAALGGHVAQDASRCSHTRCLRTT